MDPPFDTLRAGKQDLISRTATPDAFFAGHVFAIPKPETCLPYCRKRTASSLRPDSSPFLSRAFACANFTTKEVTLTTLGSSCL
jgi:hypothetical protein